MEVSDCNEDGIGVHDDDVEQGGAKCRCSEVSGCEDLVSLCVMCVVPEADWPGF